MCVYIYDMYIDIILTNYVSTYVYPGTVVFSAGMTIKIMIITTCEAL